ncbi:MAG: sigma-70 family RNA polymerase sigma factor [Acidimicrobiales bacterium]
MSAADDMDDALARYASGGDPEIRDRLVEEHRGLALFHVRRYANRGIERDDLDQVAMIGLLKAVERFDPSRNVTLATYASRTIDGELKRHFRDRGWVMRVARSVRDVSVAVRTARSQLEVELGRPPRPVQIAERLGVDTEAVLEALDASSSAYRAVPLEREDGNGEERAPTAVGQRDRGFAAVADRIMVEDLLSLLPVREQEIIKLRFYDQMTQSEIAARVGLSQMHVSRLLRRCMVTLRQELTRQGEASLPE